MSRKGLSFPLVTAKVNLDCILEKVNHTVQKMSSVLLSVG